MFVELINESKKEKREIPTRYSGGLKRTHECHMFVQYKKNRDSYRENSGGQKRTLLTLSGQRAGSWKTIKGTLWSEFN